MEHTEKTRRNLRIGHDLNQRLSQRARDIGISPNALALMLIDQGLRHDDILGRRQLFDFNGKPVDSIKITPVGTGTLKVGKKKKYVPPPYLPESDADHHFPAGMQPIPWDLVRRVGEWLDHTSDVRGSTPQPKDVARHFKIPQLQAVAAHDAYVTEFYANQLELIEKKGAR